MGLGLAGPERLRGDRRENVDQGAEALRQALEVMGDPQPSELDAIIRTNLASVLLARETDDVVANLTEARELVERSLEYRTAERNAEDWAYSQINLGLILDRLARAGAADPGEAAGAWQAVIDRASECPSYLVGHAHHGLGQQRLGQAQPNPEEMTEEEREAVESLDPDLVLLAQAGDHLHEARTLLADAPDQLARGRALTDLAQTLGLLGNRRVDRGGLAGPGTARADHGPRPCVAVTFRLGTQLADADDFQGAAGVFRAGVAAAEIAIDTRLDAPDRSREAGRGGNIARWASYCLARAGEQLEAVLTLENGRTRELRRRLGSDGVSAEALGDLPAELRESYQTALDSLASARLDGRESGASRALQEVLHRIREHPGCESFAAGTDAEGLRQAVAGTWPLLYINPTPWGTLLLLVSEGDENLQLVTEFLNPTSEQVFLRLLVGDAAYGGVFANAPPAPAFDSEGGGAAHDVSRRAAAPNLVL